MSLEGFPNAAPAPERKKKIVIAENVGALESAARDAADEKMSELGKGENFVKRIWKQNLAREWYRQKKIQEAKNKILDKEDLYANVERQPNEISTKEDHNAAMQAIVDRAMSDYAHEMPGTDSYKRPEDDPKSIVTSEEIKDTIRNYIRSENPDPEAFKDECRHIIAKALFEGDIEKARQAVHHTDNLMRVAEQLRLQDSHEAALHALDNDYEIVIARVKSGVRTEAKLNRTDRAIDWLQKKGVGKVLNEATLAGGVAIAGILAEKFGTGLIRGRIAAAATVGASIVVGGGIAYRKEQVRLRTERAQHIRERAQGKTIEPDSKRREEMNQFSYKMESAKNLVRHLHEAKNRNLGEPGNYNAALAVLADIESRIALSDDKKIDLISFSNISTVEQERTQLYLAVAEAKVALRRAAGQSAAARAGAFDFDESVRALRRTSEHELIEGEGGVNQQDLLYKKMEGKRARKVAGNGILVGLAAGTIVQETMAVTFHTQQGVFNGPGRGTFEKLPPGRTWLNYIFYGSQPYGGPVPGLAPITASDNSKIRLPEGLHLWHDPSDPPHRFVIARADNTAVTPSLEFDDQGHVTPQSADLLKRQGFGIDQKIEHINKEIPDPHTLAPEEYIRGHLIEEGHKDGFVHVARNWMDQNSPYKSVGNALRLHWGGVHETGIDAKGNYVYNVFKMTPGGSFHGKSAVNAQNLIRGGQLKMLLSMTCGTQNYVVPVDIHPDGNTVIDPNSDIGKMFFATDSKGHAVFKGQYAEVGLIIDKVQPDAKGVHAWMLATDKGSGAPTIEPSTGSKTITVDTPITTITPPEQEHHWGPMPIVPIPLPREGLEKMKHAERPRPYPSYMSYEMSLAQREDARARMSPELRDNPQIVLEHFEETQKYIARQNKEYVEKVENLLSDTRPMDPACRVAICIPVAGHQEGDTIYHTLESYLNQTADKKQFELNLFVNWPDKDNTGNSVKPDKTLNEIARFRANHPELPVRVMQEILPREQAKIGNVRKILNDAVLMRHHERGKDVPDLIMVSNDADMEGVSPEYVENFIKKFDANPKVDAMYGQIDWDPKAYIRNPLIHVGNRLLQFVYVQMQRKEKGPSYPGANFAFRSSMYSAIGGYDDMRQSGEDADIGQRMVLGRDSREAIGFAGARVSRLYTSARRMEKSLAEGIPSRLDWEKGFAVFDDKVRKFKWEDTGAPINFEDKADRERLTRGLVEVITQTLDSMRASHTGSADMHRNALGLLGIRSRTEADGRIVITEKDINKLLAGLEEYQTAGDRAFKIKTGQPVPLREAPSTVKSNSESDEPEPQSEPEPPSDESVAANVEAGTDVEVSIGNLETGGYEAHINNNLDRQDAIAVSRDNKVFVIAEGLTNARSNLDQKVITDWAHAVAEEAAHRGNISTLSNKKEFADFVRQVQENLEKQGIVLTDAKKEGKFYVRPRTTLSAAERIGENQFSILTIGDSPIYVIDAAGGSIIKQYGEDMLKGPKDSGTQVVSITSKGQARNIKKSSITNEKVELQPGQLLVLGSDTIRDYTDRGGNLKQYIGVQPEALRNMIDSKSRLKLEDASVIFIDPYKLRLNGKM